jgi:hypothetical protein
MDDFDQRSFAHGRSRRSYLLGSDAAFLTRPINPLSFSKNCEAANAGKERGLDLIRTCRPKRQDLSRCAALERAGFP